MSGGRADQTGGGRDGCARETGRRRKDAGPTIANRTLVVQLLEWLARGPRPYPEVMRAWRTSCPRLSIWEDALELGFLRLEHAEGGAGALVRLTPEGRAFLAGVMPIAGTLGGRSAVTRRS